MTRRVKARAYANIALVKYWGKRKGEGNLPATRSVSLALEALLTETEVLRIKGRCDQIEIDGKPVDTETSHRIRTYFDLWRNRKLIRGNFWISSQNHFPTGAGLASSASGFAALATALSGFSDSKINRLQLSRLARHGSGSAARSIPGGLAVLPTGTNPGARSLMTADEIPWGMVIAVVEPGKKKISSREGMELSRKTSPFFKAWITQSELDYQKMENAILQRDLPAVGTIAEENALAMHACMIATRPSLVYWNGATADLIKSAHRFREEGLGTYFTIDAGPNVIFLCRIDDLDTVARRLHKIRGVRSVISSKPAGGAEIVECE
jgi:diphosphomevalonate decarboxylase